MFTGLIEQIATVKNIEHASGAKIFEIYASFASDLKIGESVAINGACQSVIKKTKDSFSVFCMKESLMRTNLDFIKRGDKVNLERAMLLGSRFDGHIVQGHVDGMAKLKNIYPQGEAKVFEFEYDTKYIVQKGSVAINGISLTISGVSENSFCVSVIPQTLEKTNMQFLKQGDFVNIENDIFAKYIEKFLSLNDNKSQKLDEAFLRENGF